VIELVLLVPQTDPVAADIGHGSGDIEEVLEKFGRDVFVDMVGERQLERNAHQVERVHRHARSAVSLVDVAAVRQRFVAVEYADVVEPQKPALENISALDVLAVDPPGEVEHQLMKDAFEKTPVALAAAVL